MIYVNSCGHDSHHPKPCNIEHKHGVPDYLILLIKQESWIYLDGKKHIVAPNSLICFPPDTYIHYGCDAIGYNDDWIHFLPDEQESSSVRDLLPPLGKNPSMHFCIFFYMPCRMNWQRISVIPVSRSIILPSPDSGHRSTIIRRITGVSRHWRILWP